jgi:hypothetical protein
MLANSEKYGILTAAAGQELRKHPRVQPTMFVITNPADPARSGFLNPIVELFLQCKMKAF